MEAFQGVIFNSHDDFFRSPQGAVRSGDQLRLRILISKALSAYGVTLRLWDNGVERLLNMTRRNIFDHTPYGDHLEEYSLNVSCETSGLLWYYFIINTPVKPFYLVNNLEMLGGKGELLSFADQSRSFQITVTERDFSVPKWAQGAIMYQIFPDRFFKAEGFGNSEGKRMHENWQDEPDYKINEEKGYYPADDFFGGNLMGICQKLDYLKSLNVDVIYLNPIFEAYSNHRYDTGDYEKIDKLLGTEDTLRLLCEEAKKRGIRVILDGVFSHTGSDSRYFNREGSYDELGAYQSADSKYYDWYDFESFPHKYDCWWDVWSLPCVKEMTPSYVDYILTNENSIVKRWLRTGVSGWRLDVADELPDEFLKILRQSVKGENPDALILGEVWEDASNKVSYNTERQFLFGNELDSVMNYPLRNAVVSLLLEKITPSEFIDRIYSLRENYPRETFYSLMNFLSTHDLQRITSFFTGDTEHLNREEQAEYKPSREALLSAVNLHRLAALMIFILPGMPCIYYGDEAGLTGLKDPFNRKTYPWGNENTELLKWYQLLSSSRDEVLRFGEMNLDSAGSLLSIVRTYNGERRYGLINPTDTEIETLLDATYFKNDPQLLFCSAEGLQFSIRENGYYLLLPAKSGALFK